VLTHVRLDSVALNPKPVPSVPFDKTFNAETGFVKKSAVKLLGDVYKTENSPALFGNKTNSIVPEVGWTVVTKPVAFEKDNVAKMEGPPTELGEDVPICLWGRFIF